MRHRSRVRWWRRAIALWPVLLVLRSSSVQAQHDVHAPSERLWVATDQEVSLRASDGAVAARTRAAFGRPFAISSVGALAATADGGAWLLDAQNERLVRLSSGAAPTLEVEQPSPLALAVDAARGGVWISVAGGAPASRDVVKLDERGEERVRLTGFSSLVSSIAVDPAAQALWVADYGADQIVRVVGTDEALDGYDVTARRGPRHVRIDGFEQPRSVSVSRSWSCPAGCVAFTTVPSDAVLNHAWMVGAVPAGSPGTPSQT